MSINNLALEIMPDHLHLFAGAKPTITPFKIIHKLKGNTSIQLRRCFPDLKYLGYKQHFGKGFDNFWARSLLLRKCRSCFSRASQEICSKMLCISGILKIFDFYDIQEQQGKNVFEYDIYGCPTELKGQLKIGDFIN